MYHRQPTLCCTLMCFLLLQHSLSVHFHQNQDVLAWNTSPNKFCTQKKKFMHTHNHALRCNRLKTDSRSETWLFLCRWKLSYIHSCMHWGWWFERQWQLPFSHSTLIWSDTMTHSTASYNLTQVAVRANHRHSSAQHVFCSVELWWRVKSVLWRSKNTLAGNAFIQELANTPTCRVTPDSHSINPCLGVCFSCLGPGWLPPHWGLCKVMETLRGGWRTQLGE